METKGLESLGHTYGLTYIAKVTHATDDFPFCFLVFNTFMLKF